MVNEIQAGVPLRSAMRAVQAMLSAAGCPEPDVDARELVRLAAGQDPLLSERVLTCCRMSTWIASWLYARSTMIAQPRPESHLYASPLKPITFENNYSIVIRSKYTCSQRRHASKSRVRRQRRELNHQLRTGPGFGNTHLPEAKLHERHWVAERGREERERHRERH